MWSDEAAAVMADYWKTIDTVVMGRKSYEVALRQGQGGGGYPGVKTYVFSRALKPGPANGVTVVSRDVADFLKELKRQDGKDICVMGGGELARPLFEAGLIDEIGFNIHPVLLGSGIPLCHPLSRQIDPELLECKPFKNGCVLVKYRVKH
jgi:dihydrofolate reductase